MWQFGQFIAESPRGPGDRRRPSCLKSTQGRSDARFYTTIGAKGARNLGAAIGGDASYSAIAAAGGACPARPGFSSITSGIITRKLSTITQNARKRPSICA